VTHDASVNGLADRPTMQNGLADGPTMQIASQRTWAKSDIRELLALVLTSKQKRKEEPQLVCGSMAPQELYKGQ